jgi:hypothetical protein
MADSIPVRLGAICSVNSLMFSVVPIAWPDSKQHDLAAT